MNHELDPEVKALLLAETDDAPPAQARDRMAERLAATLALPLPTAVSPIAAAAAAGVIPKGLVTIGSALALAGAAFVGGGAVGAALMAARTPSAVPSAAPSVSAFAPPPRVVIPPVREDLAITDAAAPLTADSGLSAAPVRAIPEPSPTDVGAERALLDQARDLEDAHDPEGALKILDAHAARYPHGQMWEEREALAIDALVEAQKYAEARERATRLRTRSPNSLVLPAVDETLRSIP